MVDKKLRFILLTIRGMKAYFINFLAEISTFPIYIIIIYFLWKIILENSTMTVGLNDIVTYYILSFVILSITTENRVASRMSIDIREGDIVKFLARPISYIYASFWSRLGVFIFFSTFYLPTLFLFSLLFKMQVTSNLLLLFLSGISLILAMIMNFLIMFILGITSFWTTENMGVMRMFNSIKKFLAGSWIPLNLIPGGMGKIILLMPFKYMIYFPISIIQGKLTVEEILLSFGYTLIWIILFYITAKWLWKKGEKHLAGVGV